MERSSRWLIVLTVLSGLGMLVAILFALLLAPNAVGLTPDETYAQRIIYFHVPTAWLSMLAFGVTMVASIAYLASNKRHWDSLAVSSAELGLIFTLATAASGSVWAKPAWNVWWTWDPRLTTYTIVFLLFVAYFMLRSAMEDPARRARFSSVYAIFAFLSVPITFMSIRWWRTIHPVLIDPNEGFGLSPGMMTAFFIGLAAFTLFYVVLLIHRYRLERMKEQVELLKEQLGY
ncbi:MAG: Heme exporter protein C [Chloroflexi bacterium ADurb.Bin325]|nr:MAG: Heme exporter protein C [Chloroflexi bacterium ADurb.Bin325]